MIPKFVWSDFAPTNHTPKTRTWNNRNGDREIGREQDVVQGRAHTSGMVWVVEASTKEPRGTVSKAANMEPDRRYPIQSRPPPHKTLTSIDFTPNSSSPLDLLATKLTKKSDLRAGI